MSIPKFLIDTNVFIKLEADLEITPRLSALTNLASKHSVPIFVHEAARDDILRDKNKERRAVSLSKVDKFQNIEKVKNLTSSKLASVFGKISKDNDVVDATLLHALDIGAADFLVTEDRGLHARARMHAPHLTRRVLFVADAVLLLQDTYESKDVKLRYVEEIKAYQIPQDDDIFISLRGDYLGFDKWWRDKCVAQHRTCWVVFDDGIAGLIVRKDETSTDTDANIKSNKILKICAFKVKSERRGTKLGELLLRKVFWFAQQNSYDSAYLTVFDKHESLIDLIEYYGFICTGKNKGGELIYEKVFSRESLQIDPSKPLYDQARLSYPRFVTSNSVSAYCIPIVEKYHDQLFPELKSDVQLTFDMVGLGSGPKRPGNTIRKVYLCRTPVNKIDNGSILFFYKGKSKLLPSQAITAVGVFEDMAVASSTSELRLLAGGRSVYSDKDIVGWDSEKKPVKVINFLLMAYLEPPVSLEDLTDSQILVSHPQSAIRISQDACRYLLDRTSLGFQI